MENIREYLRTLSHDFNRQTLNEMQVDEDPVRQFEKWFSEAVDAEVAEPNAMMVSTSSADGKPSGRILLLRNFDQNGFVFYTNYESRKANDLENNPQAALTFFWPGLERQIRIEGTVKKQNKKESDDYFSTRPKGSQLGAWTSAQSRKVENRKVLEKDYLDVQKRFFGKSIPRPPHWGGYVLQPDMFEFWQGRPSRMHDRIIYERDNNGWQIGRLAP